MEKIYLKIKRQDRPESDSYWEDFHVPKKPGMNVISVLMEIRKNPVNAKGPATTPDGIYRIFPTFHYTLLSTYNNS